MFEKNIFPISVKKNKKYVIKDKKMQMERIIIKVSIM